MRGVSAVLENVLLAGAIMMFMIYIVGAFNEVVDVITNDRIRNSLQIDAKKVAYAIVFAHTEGSEKGTVTINLDLADIPEEMWFNDGLWAKSGNKRIFIELHGLENEVNVSGRIVNTKGFTPYVKYEDGVVYLGVD
ncbi:MAG: hypothetical protein GOV00_00810 [Candidatus Altiarchaeota archaeon]|nr:hypothetical protein [Candidatus Altiarchaeota archaeon]